MSQYSLGGGRSVQVVNNDDDYDQQVIILLFSAKMFALFGIVCWYLIAYLLCLVLGKENISQVGYKVKGRDSARACWCC